MLLRRTKYSKQGQAESETNFFCKNCECCPVSLLKLKKIELLLLIRCSPQDPIPSTFSSLVLHPALDVAAWCSRRWFFFDRLAKSGPSSAEASPSSLVMSTHPIQYVLYHLNFIFFKILLWCLI